MKRPSALALATASIVLAAATGIPLAISASAAPSKGNAAEGKKIFTVKCVACHKPNGTGGLKLTGNPTPNWTDKKRMATITDDYLRDCITNGKVKSGMVAWGKTGQIKPAEIENLIAYIRTFAK
jgi:mono/diheme cytochrome c family protein